MTIIRQTSLFSIQELYDMEPTQKYDAIISAIDLDAIHFDMVTIVYNASKLAVDRINTALNRQVV